MKGRIKAGEGTLIGNAGEYYVMAELLKTKSQEFSLWQFNVKKDGGIFRDISKERDFTVLVDLAMETKDLKFYVVPTHQVNAWLKEDFERWVSTPGKNNRPHSQTNPKRNLRVEKHTQELSKYLNQWEKLWE